ncbi:MAG: DUF1223 domain-containing protein [Bacteroidetes bacterium]|nr:DUF1223 domain-containing protein [Bacteroidota bacterium]
MKHIKTFLLSIGLSGVLIALAAFMKMQNEKTLSNIQKDGDNKGFAVVELFTSEGCSSCPPADELVANLEKDNKNKNLFILAYHVDYWNHQGWKDRFSDPAYSARQQQYSDWLNLQTIYTPQIVVNGTSEYVGSDEPRIIKAISNGLGHESPAPNNLIIDCGLVGRKLNITFSGASAPSGDPSESSRSNKHTELVLALIEKQAQSDVKAGENAGHVLSHAQIVRQLLHVDPNSKSPVTLSLPDNFQKDNYELIGFVQNTKTGQITAATKSQL